MQNRPPHNPYALNPWQYHQMQKAMEQKGFTKKKGCGCGKKKQVKDDNQENN